MIELFEVWDLGENNFLAEFGYKNQPSKGKLFFKCPNKSGTFEASLSGFNADGNAFAAGNYTFQCNDKDILGEDGKVNPTKVFWIIYKAAKGVLCPNCTDGY